MKDRYIFYSTQSNLDFNNQECLPIMEAYRKFNHMRLYSKGDNNKISDSDIDKINIRNLSLSGFEYKNHRWYF